MDIPIFPFNRSCPATPLKVGFNRGEEHKGQVEVVLPYGTRLRNRVSWRRLNFEQDAEKTRRNSEVADGGALAN